MKYSYKFLTELERLINVSSEFENQSNLQHAMKEKFRYLNRTSKNYIEVIYEKDIQLAYGFDHYVYNLVSTNPETTKDKNITIYCDLVYNQILENPLSALTFPIFYEPKIAKLCFGEERYNTILNKYNQEMNEVDEIMDTFLEIVNSNEYQQANILEKASILKSKITEEQRIKLLKGLLYSIPNESPKMHECTEKYVEYLINYYHYNYFYLKAISGFEKEILIKFICYEELKYYEDLLFKCGYGFDYRSVMFILSDLVQNKDIPIKENVRYSGGYTFHNNTSFISIENHHKDLKTYYNFYCNLQVICHESGHIFQWLFSKVKSFKALEIIIEIILTYQLGHSYYEKNVASSGLEYDADLRSFIRMKHYLNKYLKLEDYSAIIGQIDELIKTAPNRKLNQKITDENNTKRNPSEYKFQKLQEIMKENALSHILRYPILHKLFDHNGQPRKLLDILAELDIQSIPDFDNTFLEYCQYLLKEQYSTNIDIDSFFQMYNRDSFRYSKDRYLDKVDTFEKILFKNAIFDKNASYLDRYPQFGRSFFKDEYNKIKINHNESECKSILFGLLKILKMVEQKLELIYDNFDVLVTNEENLEDLNNDIANLKETFLKCNLIIGTIFKQYLDLRWMEYSYLTDDGSKVISSHILYRINNRVIETISYLNNKTLRNRGK